MSNEKHIFLSYSRKDEKFALHVAHDLKRHGFNVWVDQINIPDGKHWDDTIEEALNNSCVMILILSPDSVESNQVKDEVSYAQDNNIHIMPINYKAAKLPYRWRRLQSTDINEKNYDKKIDGFIKSIKNFVSCEITDPPPKKPKRTGLKVFVIASLVIASALTYVVNIKNDTDYSYIKLIEKKTIVEVKEDKNISIPKIVISKPKPPVKIYEPKVIKEISTVKIKPIQKPKKEVIEIIEPKHIDANNPYADIYNTFMDKLQKNQTTKLIIISHTNSNNEFDKAQKKAFAISLKLRDRGLHRSAIKTEVIEDRSDRISYDFRKTVR